MRVFREILHQLRRDTLKVYSDYFFVEKRICCFEGSFVYLLKYDKQDQQGKAAFKERNPHQTQ
jgi:hypothetical protein